MRPRRCVANYLFGWIDTTMRGSVALLYWSAERLPDGRLGMVLIKLLRFQDFGAVENSLAVARSFQPRSLAQFASAGWHLLKASEAAAESNSNKDEFIAVLSHE